jgi:cation:H+ antiporter
LSDFFIGVAILAVGSDLPEIVVAVAAALKQLAGSDTANLIVGNSLGSCLGQFGLVMGVAGILGQLSLPRNHVLIHGGVLLTSMLLLTVVGWDGEVDRFEGAVLIASFLAYIIFLVGDEGVINKARQALPGRMKKTWLLLLLGIATVLVSAELIVYMALELAIVWEIDQSYIGIAIIGVGTSLPEMMISVGAAMRSRMGMSVGNLIGSNILDVLLPIGIAALMTPLSFARELLTFDLPVLFALSILILVLLLLPGGIRRPQALLLLFLYGGYITTITFRS